MKLLLQKDLGIMHQAFVVNIITYQEKFFENLVILRLQDL